MQNFDTDSPYEAKFLSAGNRCINRAMETMLQKQPPLFHRNLHNNSMLKRKLMAV